MAFCPSVFKLSFWLLFASLFDGCLRWWGRFWWPWGKFIFYSALSSIGSVLLSQRHQIFVFGLILMKSILLTSRNQFNFCSALPSVGSISMTLRHQFDFCPRFGEADFVDLEVPVYFLQCAFFSGVDFADPEARFWPFWVPSFGWSRSYWLRGASLFLAVDRSLTSRLWACWK